MTVFFGSYGALVPVACPSSEEVEVAPRVSTGVTLGGRVVAQRGPRPRRVWQARVGANPASTLTALDALYLGETSDTWWLSAYALGTNMLTPEESLLLPGHFSPGAARVNGGVAADGVYVPNAVAVSNGSFAQVGELQGAHRVGVPVRPGDTITVSAYGAGQGRLRVWYRDISGNFLTSHTAGSVFSHGLSRVSFSSVVPERAVSATLNVVAPQDGTVVFGAPAISLGSGLTPYGTGGGCRRAVITSLHKTTEWAVPGQPGMNYISADMTVTEVG